MSTRSSTLRDFRIWAVVIAIFLGLYGVIFFAGKGAPVPVAGDVEADE